MEAHGVASLRTAVLHVPGTRRRQEDEYSILRTGLGQGGAGEGVIAIVADGMGGHEGGRMAAAEAVAAARNYILISDDPLPLRLQNAIGAANRRVRAVKSRHGVPEAGCAMAIAACLPTAVFVAHVGDCRAYICADGKVQQLTRDHTADAEARGGWHGDSVLTRSVGSEPNVESDVVARQAYGPYRVMVCSDGVIKPNEVDALNLLLSSRTIGDATSSLEGMIASRPRSDNATSVIIESGDFEHFAAPSNLVVERPAWVPTKHRRGSTVSKVSAGLLFFGAALATFAVMALLTRQTHEPYNSIDMREVLNIGQPAFIGKREGADLSLVKDSMPLLEGDYIVFINSGKPRILFAIVEGGQLRLLPEDHAQGEGDAPYPRSRTDPPAEGKKKLDPPPDASPEQEKIPRERGV